MARVNFAGQVVTGKSNGLIFQTWKGIHYMKAYTIPRNPRTPAQQKNRTTFGIATKYATSIYKTLYSGNYPEQHTAELYRQILTQCKSIFETNPESLEDADIFNQLFTMPYTHSSPFSEGWFGIYHKSTAPENVNTIWLSTSTNIAGQTFYANVYWFENNLDYPFAYRIPITFEYDESENNYSAEFDLQMTFTATAINYLRGQVQISKDNIFYSAFLNYNLYN